MEILFGIFKGTMLIAGILFFLAIIVSIIITPINERKKKKIMERKLADLKEFDNKLDKMLEEYINAIKEKKQKENQTKKVGRPKKKDTK